MDMGSLIQIVSCALTTLCGIGAIAAALWTVYESKRPQPIAYLEKDRDNCTIVFVVENFGNGVATNIKVSNFDYSADYIAFEAQIRKSFISTGIPLLVPGGRRDTIVCIDPLNCETPLQTITLSYEEKSFFGRTKVRKEKFELDYSSFSGSLYNKSDIHVLAQSCKKIAKGLQG